MRYKTLLILTLILISVLSFSCVNASECNLTDIQQPYDSNTISETTDHISTDPETTLSPQPGTFTDLHSLIENSSENDEIKLEKDYLYDENTDFELKKGMNITKNLTIDGQDHTINANSKAKIFSVYAEVTLKNIRFVSAYGEIENNYYSAGVAVKCYAPSNITNCIFENNYVDGFGTILIRNDGNIVNCTFINNTATRDGGAVCFEGNGKVYNSIFINNSGLAGGAVDIEGSGVISNCSFIGNDAIFGGAFYGYSLTVSKSKFVKNHGWTGGAIALMNGNIAECNFTDNWATHAGAIDINHGNCILTNCKFSNNLAENTGGAVNFDDLSYNIGLTLTPSVSSDGHRCTILNCSFSNNSANYGGAVQYDGKGDIVGCNFTDNTAGCNGGAVNFNNIDGPTTHTFDAEYGLIEVKDNQINRIINSDFTNNSARYGGAIFCNYNDIINCSFSQNTAKLGEGIYFKENESSLINSTFANNGWFSEEKIITYNVTDYPKYQTDIKASGLKITYGDARTLIITLKSNLSVPLSDKDIIIQWNGKTFSYTTDSRGKVSFRIDGKMIPKKYDLNIIFKGHDSYYKSEKKITVTIDKANLKLKIGKNTYKRKVKIKKFSITLTNSKKQPIKSFKATLKIKGKTFHAKTDSHGKATFKITKLTKKGTYKAKITIKGNGYYNKIIKTVKIKIR